MSGTSGNKTHLIHQVPFTQPVSVLLLVFLLFSFSWVNAEEDPELWRKYNHRAMELCHQGDYEDAAIVGHLALYAIETSGGPNHYNVAPCLNNLGKIYHALGDYSEAVSCYERSIQIMEDSFGPENAALLMVLDNLSRVKLDQKKYKEAEDLLWRALKIGEQSDHAHLESIIGQFALCFFAQNKPDEMENLLLQQLAFYSKEESTDFEGILVRTRALSSLYLFMEDWAEYEEFQEKSLSIMMEHSDHFQMEIPDFLEDYSNYFQSQANTDSARKYSKMADEYREK